MAQLNDEMAPLVSEDMYYNEANAGFPRRIWRNKCIASVLFSELALSVIMGVLAECDSSLLTHMVMIW